MDCIAKIDDFMHSIILDTHLLKLVKMIKINVLSDLKKFLNEEKQSVFNEGDLVFCKDNDIWVLGKVVIMSGLYCAEIVVDEVRMHIPLNKNMYKAVR